MVFVCRYVSRPSKKNSGQTKRPGVERRGHGAHAGAPSTHSPLRSKHGLNRAVSHRFRADNVILAELTGVSFAKSFSVRRYRGTRSSALLRKRDHHDVTREQGRQSNDEAVRAEVLDACAGRERTHQLAKSAKRDEAAIRRRDPNGSAFLRDADEADGIETLQ